MKTINQYTIEKVCELTGISRRTVRYYVQEGLIPPPAGRGRGGFYNDSHVARLRRLKTLQEQGFPLSTIRELLAHPEAEISQERELWVRYPVTDGIEVHVRRDVEDRNGRRLSVILQAFKTLCKNEEEE